MTLFQFLGNAYQHGRPNPPIRIDDRAAVDVYPGFCSIVVRECTYGADHFELVLNSVPWDEHVEALVDEMGGEWSGTSTARTLTVSVSIKNITAIRKLAQVIRKVAGRGRCYSDRNWKWVTRRTADSLQRFADLLKGYRHAGRVSIGKHTS